MAVAIDMQHRTSDMCCPCTTRRTLSLLTRSLCSPAEWLVIVEWKREEMTLVPMGSSLRLIFFKQPRPNRPAISLPCSSFQIGANRLLCIAAPLYFGSGSVRSIHEKSWSALLASSFVASRSSARVSKGRCFSELVPLAQVA